MWDLFHISEEYYNQVSVKSTVFATVFATVIATRNQFFDYVTVPKKNSSQSAVKQQGLGFVSTGKIQ